MKTGKYEESFRSALRARRMAENTIKTYMGCLSAFMAHFKESYQPKDITAQQIQEYIISLPSAAYQRQMHGCVKNFYRWVVHQPNKMQHVPFAKKNEYLPNVLSPEQVQAILNSCQNIKHKTILAMIYACGLRVSEAIDCTFSWIDRSRGILTITGKGNKQRQAPLPPLLLDMLSTYYRLYRPKTYLFEGPVPGSKYSASSIRAVLREACRAAKISKRITPHCLRHSYATHLLESGTDIRVIQKLLGHANSKTTEIYTHVSTAHIASLASPISRLAIS